MTPRISRVAIVIGFAAGLGACAPKPSETDVKVAELQKQLEATRQELAARTAEAGAVASGAAQTAADAQAASEAGNRKAADRAAEAASQANADRAATERALADQQRALADQQAATTRQAEENARLQREVEALRPREVTVPAGTMIAVRTTAALSTQRVTTGSTFDALLEEDLVVGGTVLAKAGSGVVGVVASSDPGGRVKGVASMAIRVRSITGARGEPIAIRTTEYAVQARSTAGRDAARTGVAAGAGAVIGAIAGGGRGAAIGAGVGAAGGAGVAAATRGEPAVVPTETLIQFELTAPVIVVVRNK